MIHPDLLITWIKHCDYPLFRQWLRKYRTRFGKVIILFSEHNRFPYFDHFIHSDLSDLDITFLDTKEYVYGEGDWRNVSTNAMLEYSDSEWVCSIEQDWFSRDWDQLLDLTEEAMKTNDLVGWDAPVYDTFYIHPAYWFIKRSVLEQTKKNFAAENGLDHFGWITRDVEALGGKIFGLTKDGGLNTTPSPDAHSFHLGGVNQNYLEGLREGFVFHREEPFSVYNRKCMNIPSPMMPTMEKIAEKLASLPDNHEWDKFFV